MPKSNELLKATARNHTSRMASMPPSACASSRTILINVILLCVLASSNGSLFAQAAASGKEKLPPTSSDRDMHQGRVQFQQGAFPQAAAHWMDAARGYEESGQVKEQCQALINVAHALRLEGQIRRAQGTLQAALRLSEQIGNRLLTATILGQLGTTSHILGQEEPATEHLTKALSLAREERKPTLVAGLLNDLGNALTARRQFLEAIDVYAESRALALETRQPDLAATAQINGAMAHLNNRQFEEAQRQFDQAGLDMQPLADSHAKTAGWLNIGLGYQDLHAAVATSAGGTSKKQDAGLLRSGESRASAGAEGPLLRRASEAFVTAGEVAGRIGDARGQSYAWGYLGGLHEKQHRPTEALEYSRKALFAAQKINAPESLYRWEWQTARLLAATGREEEALAAYQRALSSLKPIGYEYSVGEQGRHHSFEESVAPLFVQYEDALLRRASADRSPERTQQLLVRVRDTVEASHAAELQDYFRDDCVATARGQRGPGAVPAETALVYPLSLPDRLELLVETAGGLKRYRVPVKAETLTNEVRTFRRLVQDRRSQDYLSSAQTLYGWLIAPLQQDFLAAGITTLVMVPEGPLRTIPIAALHDGRQFVVSRYAVATIPSMELTDPRPVPRGKGTGLAMGLTESVAGTAAKPDRREELHAVNALYGGTSLVNSEFSVTSLEQQIKNHGLGIVHVASHSQLGPDVSQSFLQAYDGKISMDRLAQMVGLSQHRRHPLELLTLSASETAVDDDRAALGLAGVAVKTGARSALASLWVAEDQAAPELVAEFYRQLQDSTVSKAVALQRAQQKILAQPGHSHPSLWASFLLISNWM
jgi:CHAT domain-containing protein